LSALGRVRLIMLAVVALVLQRTLLDGLRLSGAHPDVMVVLVLAIGYLGGPERGALAGFLIGLLVDAFLPTPFGLTALTWTLAGYGAGLVKQSVLESSGITTALTVVGGSMVATAGFAVLAALLGQPDVLHAHLAVVLIVVGAGAVVLGPVCLWACSWAGVRAASEKESQPGAALGAAGAARVANRVSR